MKSQTLFDLLDAGISYLWFATLPGALVLLSLAWLVFHRTLADITPSWAPLYRDKSGQPRYFVFKGVGIWMLSISTLIFVAFFGGALEKYFYFSKSYKNNDFVIVEGEVEAFQAAAYCVTDTRGMKWGVTSEIDDDYPFETFKVGKWQFTYSDYVINGGYHKSKPCGGFIENGMNVTIWHVNGVIIRIEKHLG